MIAKTNAFLLETPDIAKHRPADTAKTAQQIYGSGPPMMRMLQHWRPMICPYHILVDQVPPGARVLDVGSGPGSFLARSQPRRPWL